MHPDLWATNVLGVKGNPASFDSVPITLPFLLGKHVIEIKSINGYGKAGVDLSFHVGLAAGCHRQVSSLIIIISQYNWHHILAISHTPKSISSPQEKFLPETGSLCWENWHVQADFPASSAQADLGPPGYPVRSLPDENCQIKLFPSIVTSALFHLQPWLPPQSAPGKYLLCTSSRKMEECKTQI